MRVVVVGDVLLDRDLDGPSTRLSPDAGVPVIDVELGRSRAGGAGLVARLAAADGHAVTLVTVLSDDPAAAELRRRLAGVDVVAGPSVGPTAVKTRVFRAGRPVVRVDEGCGPPAEPSVTPGMLAALEAADAVVVADYGRGLLGDEALRAALARCARRVPVVWDPHPRGVAPVPGVTVATPNLVEALGFSGGAADAGPDAAPATASALREAWGVGSVVVTLGADGAWVQRGPADGVRLPAPALGEVDTCGAGDRFAVTLATALATPGTALPDAVAAAIDATATFLRAGGVAGLRDAAHPASRSLRSPRGTSGRLEGQLSDAPYPAAPQPTGGSDVIRGVRSRGGTIVATGGCFDLIHAGHLRTLRAARALGDALVVCLNSDDSVRRLKGPERPLMPQDDRAELLSALDCVDAVIVFGEDTPLAVLDRLRPDVWVKGGDYIAQLLPEHELVSRWGGRCVTVPYHPGRSTTSLAEALDRIR